MSKKRDWVMFLLVTTFITAEIVMLVTIVLQAYHQGL